MKEECHWSFSPFCGLVTRANKLPFLLRLDWSPVSVSSLLRGSYEANKGSLDTTSLTQSAFL